MARHALEFTCSECGWFNYPMLDDKMYGNYTIVCGHCAHHHYRVVKAGHVTADRHDKRLGVSEVIHVMPSAAQKEPRKLGSIAQLRQLEATGLIK